MGPIEYGPPGTNSIGNMDLGSIFHGVHILYDTGSRQARLEVDYSVSLVVHKYNYINFLNPSPK